MTVQRFNPDSMMKPTSSFCQAARRGNVVTTTGVAAIDRDGRVVGENDMAAQAKATLDNLRFALEAAGASLADVIKVTVYITDFGNFSVFNGVFTEYFCDAPPARTTIRADLIVPQLLVEVDAIAVVGD